MSIINPITGVPYNQPPQQPAIPQEQIIKAVNTLAQRLEILSAKNLIFDCALEVVFETLAEKLDINKEELSGKVEEYYKDAIAQLEAEAKARTAPQAVNLDEEDV